jgi:hypothetical protein
MKKEGWRKKWRRLMVESGFFSPVRIADLQSIAKYDEISGISPEKSVASWIRLSRED